MSRGLDDGVHIPNESHMQLYGAIMSHIQKIVAGCGCTLIWLNFHIKCHVM
jgi:hypothetical protein